MEAGVLSPSSSSAYANPSAGAVAVLGRSENVKFEPD